MLVRRAKNVRRERIEEDPRTLGKTLRSFHFFLSPSSHCRWHVQKLGLYAHNYRGPEFQLPQNPRRELTVLTAWRPMRPDQAEMLE